MVGGSGGSSRCMKPDDALMRKKRVLYDFVPSFFAKFLPSIPGVNIA